MITNVEHVARAAQSSRRWMWLTCVTLAFAMGGAASLGDDRAAPQAGGAAGKDRAAAIFGMTGLPIDRHLEKLGWQVDQLHWGHNYTADDLKRFHVIVIATHPRVSDDAVKNDQFVVSGDYHKAFRAALEEFVFAGGGLLVYQSLWPTNSLDAVNTLLAPFGARFLEEEIQDAAHEYTQDSGMLWTWLYTTNVSKHECCNGIDAIFYPTRDLHIPAHAPLAIEPPWHTLIKGMASSSSHPTKQVQQNRIMERGTAGTYAAAPPLAAVRRFGSGGVVALGWCPTQTYFNYQHFMVQDVHFTGTTAQPSDGLKFLEQVLSHLSTAAVTAGLGGYRQPIGAREIPLETALDWTVLKPATGRGRWWKGVIGARSELTGGSGRPADYALAAEKAGLGFIAFLEDMTRLDPRTWDAFRRECRDASNDNVLVLPGLVELRGDAETEYFFVGDGPLPPADMRSADGRTVINYLYAHFAMGEWTHGPFSLRRQRTPPWISRAYTAQAAVSTLNGESTVEMAPYLYNVGIQDCPRPVAVDRINSPTDVADAARRYVTLRRADTLAGVRTAFQRPDRGGPGQVSNGPLVTEFEPVNAVRDSQGRPAAGRERFQVRLVAESDSPLREALIYNGSEIHQRFELKGNHCDILVNGVHDRQYTLTAVVFDDRGRFSTCGPLEVYDVFNRRFICSDRQNSIGLAVRSTEQGKRLQIDACLQQHKFQTHGDLPGEPASAATVGWVPWYWDGSPGSMFKGRLLNSLAGVTSSNPSKPMSLVHRMTFPLGSQDVIIQGAVTEGRCEKPPHSQEFTPVLPLPYRAEVRFHEFRKRADAPTSMLIEGQYEVLEDMPLPKQPWLYETRIPVAFYGFGGRPSSAARWAVVGRDGAGEVDRPFPPKQKEHNAFYSVEPGGYVAFTSPEGSLTLFPLDTKIGFWLWMHDEQWLRGWAGFPHPGAVIPKGTRFPYRAVVLCGSPASARTRGDIKRFREEFGLANAPKYDCRVKQGRIMSQNYVLEVEAADAAFSADFAAADLVHDLPVRVHGVSRRWTCVIVDPDTKAWRPVGTSFNLAGVTPGGHATAAYIAIDLSRPQSVWIGHPVVCDSDDLQITLFTDGRGTISVEVHNPTRNAMKATIWSNPGCPLPVLPATMLHLEPRSSRTIAIP